MTYDMLSRPLTAVYPDGTSESYTYDMVNNVTTYTGKNGTVQKVYFDKWGNIIKATVVNGDNEIILNEYTYDIYGRMQSYKRPISDSIYTKATYGYDYLGRIVRETVMNQDDEELRVTTYSHTLASDSDSRPIYTTTATITGDGGTYAKYSETSDYRGNITEKKYFTDTETRAYTYTHDYVGNVLTETNPAGQVTTTTYDYLNRPLTVTNAAGDTKTCEYNALDLLDRESDFMGNFTSYTYDNTGRLIAQSTPLDESNSSLTKMYYDSNGNVIQTKVQSNTFDSETATFEVTDNAYDSMNRLSYTVVHPDDTTTIYTQYEYNSLGLPDRVIYGLTALIEPGAEVPTEASAVNYEYDYLGRTKKVFDGNGDAESYSYDRHGRLKVKRDKNLNLTIYYYDDFDNLTRTKNGDIEITNTYNTLGQKTSMTDSTGTTTYTYNAFGELTTETKGDIIKTYSYDNVSNRTAFTVTNSGSQLMSLTYGYDSLNRLTSVTDGTDVTAYTYDANSNELTASLNGTVYKSSVYNCGNMPTTVYYPNTGSETNRITYTYCVNGNLHSYTSRLDYQSGRVFRYDGSGRLSIEVGALDDGYTNHYTYDTRGNISSVRYKILGTSDDPVITNYTYDKANKLLTSSDGTNNTAYAYDDNGNMLSVTTNDELIKSYTYDDLNRLTASTVNGVSTSYTYAGDNLRQTKTTNGVTTQHIYDGMNVIADIQGTDISTFIRGNGLVYGKNLSTGERTV